MHQLNQLNRYPNPLPSGPITDVQHLKQRSASKVLLIALNKSVCANNPLRLGLIVFEELKLEFSNETT